MFLTINAIIILLCLYITSIMHRNQPIYLDSLSFFLSPLEERRRLRFKLYHIVHNLYKSGDYMYHNRKHRPIGNPLTKLSSAGLRRDSIMLHVNLATNQIALVNPKEKRHRQQQLEIQSTAQFKCSCTEESEQRVPFIESISWLIESGLMNWILDCTLSRRLNMEKYFGGT